MQISCLSLAGRWWRAEWETGLGCKIVFESFDNNQFPKYYISGIRGILFSGGEVTFPDFPGRFPGRNLHFGTLKTKYSGSKSEKQKKKQTNKQTKTKKATTTTKKVLCSFSYFLPFNFQFSPSFYNFSSFLLPFPLSPCLSFPGRSANISR